MLYAIVTLMSLALVFITVKMRKQQEHIIELETILYVVAEDVQEVRTVTHGKPKIGLKAI